MTRPTPPVTIRRVGPEDATTVLTLLRELAEHQDQLQHVAVTVNRWRELLSREDVIVLLAECDDGRPVGYVSVVRHLNLWACRDILGLDDLYVRPQARNGGVGQMLMTEVARLAAPEQLVIRWEVHRDNEAAQRFYTRLGAGLTTKVIAGWAPHRYAGHTDEQPSGGVTPAC
ncbi:GNAT family N-acetyltransferase [Sphaerisporangium perillae]|uniref:GNAT family N-acetyltransferase n=1 Tax=Sphaerisporangium perillae TaxID=2935860 RepID=UPI00200F4058|nr:GNAT family N-acetyltransferase [Sphaerisporangium perillae]